MLAMVDTALTPNKTGSNAAASEVVAAGACVVGLVATASGDADGAGAGAGATVAEGVGVGDGVAVATSGGWLGARAPEPLVDCSTERTVGGDVGAMADVDAGTGAGSGAVATALRRGLAS